MVIMTYSYEAQQITNYLADVQSLFVLFFGTVILSFLFDVMSSESFFGTNYILSSFAVYII